jgi:hypothetical protein
MSATVKGIKITLNEVINIEAISASSGDYIIPKKATVLSNNSGTLIQAEDGSLYLVTLGNWFRSAYNNKGLPQVDEFNQLQDLGFTVIKDKLIRNEEKPVLEEKKNTEIPNGQEIRRQDNVGIKKVDKAVASNIKSQKKN